MRTLRSVKLAAAVAVALAGSAAHALAPPATTEALQGPTFYDVKLVVSGSSAFRNSFQAEFQTSGICQAGTFDQFVANTGNNPDFRAYSCQLVNGAPFTGTFAGLANKRIIVYYRSEGGSVWGPLPIVSPQQVKRLMVQAPASTTLPRCTTTAANAYVCPVTGYNIDTEGQGPTDALVVDNVDLGVSDEEPEMFVGENAPVNALNVPPSWPANTLDKDFVVEQVFSVLVNTQNAPTSTLTNLSRQSISSILSGSYSNWNQVPETFGVNLPIVVCRREKGSGTQVAASVYFNNQNCSPAAFSSLDADGVSVIESNATPAMLTCISTHPGAIGYANVQAANPANARTISIDGVFPNSTGAPAATPANNAASGKYPWFYEVYFSGASGFLTSSSANNARFAQYIKARLQDVTRLPNNSSNLLAIPNGANFAASTATRLVAEGSRLGNTCALPQGQPH